MKTLLPLTSLFMVAAIQTVHAQPTINLASVTPDYGTEITTFSTQYLDANEEAANATWDFSSLTPQTSVTQTAMAPTGQPGAELFPDATHVFQTIQGGQNVLTYQKYADNVMALLGLYMDINPVYAMIYSDPQVLLQFPLTFGDDFTDSFYGEADMGSGILLSQQGDYQTMVTGYGTLMTPTGTYSNVLQVKMETAIYTTTEFNGTVLSQDTGTSSLYQYIQAGTPYALATMSTIESGTGGSPEQMGVYADEVSGLFSDIEDAVDLRLYPNPTRHDVNLDFKLRSAGPVTIDLLSPDGRMLTRIMNGKNLPSGSISIRRNLPDLATGLYLVRIDGPDGSSIKKLAIR